MAVYVITWNINKERSNYNAAREAFVAHLEKLENKRDQGLETVRFVSTTSTPNEIDAYLRQKLDNDDRLFVSRLNAGQHQGWLTKEVWDWINARL